MPSTSTYDRPPQKHQLYARWVTNTHWLCKQCVENDKYPFNSDDYKTCRCGAHKGAVFGGTVHEWRKRLGDETSPTKRVPRPKQQHWTQWEQGTSARSPPKYSSWGYKWGENDEVRNLKKQLATMQSKLAQQEGPQTPAPEAQEDGAASGNLNKDISMHTKEAKHLRSMAKNRSTSEETRQLLLKRADECDRNKAEKENELRESKSPIEKVQKAASATRQAQRDQTYLLRKKEGIKAKLDELQKQFSEAELAHSNQVALVVQAEAHQAEMCKGLGVSLDADGPSQTAVLKAFKEIPEEEWKHGN